MFEWMSKSKNKVSFTKSTGKLLAQQTIVMKLPETLKSKTASVSATFSYSLKTAANFEVKRHIERHTKKKKNG